MIKDLLPTPLKSFVNLFTSPKDKKRSYDDLVSHIEKLQAILHHTGDGLELLDNKGDILFATPSVEEITGEKITSIIGKNYLDFLFPEDKKRVTLLMSRFLKVPGMTIHEEFKIPSKKNTFMWVEVTAVNLLDNPSVGSILVTFRDITKSKEVFNTLQEQAKLLDISHDAIFVHDKDNCITYWNKGSETLYGYTAKEAEGQTAYKLLKTVFPKSLKSIRNYFKKHTTWHGRLHHVTKKGKQLIVDSRWEHVDSHGEKYLELNRDITKEVILEKKIEESQSQIKAILENVADGITAQDKEGKLIFINSTAARDMGYTSPNAALKAPPLEYIQRFSLFDENGNAFAYDKLPGRRALSGEKHPQVTLNYVNAYGVGRWVTIKSTAVKGEHGKPLFVINVMSDITAMKDLEKRKNDFISMASHELKTPLTSTMLYNQMLLKEFGTEKKATVRLKKMQNQLLNLSDLVRELLDVTSMQRGKLTIKKQRFYVRELVEETVEILQPITQHSLVIDWHTHHLVAADKDRIRQVITNLITNAIKYSPDHKPIILSSNHVGKEIIVSVKDSGRGIPKSQQNKIFERFYQAEGDHKTFPGLGLGLYIASEIVKLHNGRIWVDSEVGKGSIFYFSLPISL